MLNAKIDLIALAKDKTDSGRRALADVTANELLSHTRDFNDAELQYFGEIFSHLYNYIEPTLKKKIANAVSLADWAPKSLVQSIAHDDADIAAPVISFSQKFEDADLAKIVKNGTIDHHLRVAERSNIGEIVSSALVDVNEIRVVEVLSKNHTASINEETMRRAIEIAKSDTTIIDNFMVRRDVSNKLREIASALGSKIAQDHIQEKKVYPLRASIEKIEHEFTITKRPADTYNALEAFNQLESGNKEDFLDVICKRFEINKEQLEISLGKEKVETFVLLARAIDFELDQVSPMIKALGHGHVYRPEFRLAIESLWSKYDNHSALEQLYKQFKAQSKEK
ncbi:MAG: DUF2336 domain-containing protein [Caulobacterales bacterium]|nr:DUF2336 domain-containing protein [Caulobacterales bacterium]MCA0372909.1 DUF2336 domain-containing protein [Pseudomonadota bacterium]